MTKQKAARSRKTPRPSFRKRGRPLFGPLHPWRLCPIGEHRVRAHERQGTKGVSTHCRKNSSHRDQIYDHEMHRIAEEFFPTINGPPSPDKLGFKKYENEFDPFIRGWTKYWNEILQPKDRLDPNLVKALIGTESSFNPNADTKIKGSGRARGLMQVTDGTRKILKDEEGELDEHLLTLSDKDAYDPNLNIAAGVRWLFHKRKLASAKLKREATWMEAAFEYKSVLRKPRNIREKAQFPKIRAKLEKYYKQLKDSEKP